MDRLTPREYEVAMLLARGFSNRKIARELGLTGTVEASHAQGSPKTRR